jgi:ribose transport system ATP-binding protein
MLQLKSITKRFPGVTALDEVSLQFRPGEIHALMGENGAGKSTLINIIAGIYQPDEGEIYQAGRRVAFRNYGESQSNGINIVHQEIQVIPEASLAENIMLDKMVTLGKTGFVNWKEIHRAAQAVMKRVGLDLAPTTQIGRLSVAEKQLAQIARALASNARVLLLDEPTSSLTEYEAAKLFEIVRGLKRDGVIIIFVSHKIDEVYHLCDRVSVLRDGHHVGTESLAKLERSALIKMMIGRKFVTEDFGKLDVDKTKEVLRASHVTTLDKAHDISFSLYEGEILGFYGLVGAGRTELARILVGADPMDEGEVFIHGKRAKINSVSQSLYRYKMGYVTENRKEEGLLLEASILTNIGITIWSRLVSAVTRLLRRGEERMICSHMAKKLDIRSTGLDQQTQTLSGGNQQKTSLAKWLVAGCDILIIDEPTVGVDVGAKAQIHKVIWDLAKKERKSVILISSEMPEMINLASRILVFKEKRVAHEIADIRERGLKYEDVSHEIGHHLN